jgi:hypothetical protein
MRWAAILALLLAFARFASAQEPSRIFSSDDSRWRELESQYQEGRSFRAAGIVLTIAGSALVALGLPIYLADPGNEGFPARAFGGVVMAGGGVAIVSGVPIWIYGSHEMRDAERRGYRAWRPFVAPTPGGVVAGVSLASF